MDVRRCFLCAGIAGATLGAACAGSNPVADPTAPIRAYLGSIDGSPSTPSEWRRVEELYRERDRELRERFRRIEPGMAPVDVLAIVGEPSERGQRCTYRLSSFSDTDTEVGHAFHVGFEDGRVRGKQWTYTWLFVVMPPR